MGGCPERTVKQHVEWRACGKLLNVRGFGAVSDLQNRPPNRRSRVDAVRGRPETPSGVYVKTRFGAPVYARRGGPDKRRKGSRSKLGFGGSGASQDGAKMALIRPRCVVAIAPNSRFTVFYDALVSWTINRMHIYRWLVSCTIQSLHF